MDRRELVSTHVHRSTQYTSWVVFVGRRQSVWVVASVVGVVVKVERDVLVLHCACAELIKHVVPDVGEEKVLQIDWVVTTGSCN